MIILEIVMLIIFIAVCIFMTWWADRQHRDTQYISKDLLKCIADLDYIGGIVVRGTGMELKQDVPITEQLLDYVKSLEVKAKAYDDSRKAMKG